MADSTSQPRQRLTRYDILTFLNTHAQHLHNLGVRKLGLFGSHARDAATIDSDIDLLVVLAEPDFFMYMDIKFFIQDHLERQVDLVEEHLLRPELRASVMRDVVYVESIGSLSQ